VSNCHQLKLQAADGKMRLSDKPTIATLYVQLSPSEQSYD
jgi:hypothetical protein